MDIKEFLKEEFRELDNQLAARSEKQSENVDTTQISELLNNSDFKSLIENIIERFFNYFFLEKNTTLLLNGHMEIDNPLAISDFINTHKGQHFTESVKQNLSFDFLFLAFDWINSEDKENENLNSLNVHNNKLFLGDALHHCSLCGGRMELIYDLEKGTVEVLDKITESTCPVTQSQYNNVNLAFSCPSKSLVIGNDLRALLTDQENEYIHGESSVNNLKGNFDVTLRSFENSMPQIYVGNTSPDIIQNEDGSIEISQLYEETTKEGKIGSIITDLWWVCIMDRDDFLTRCQQRNISPEKFSVVHADVGKTSLNIQYDPYSILTNGDGYEYSIKIV